MYSQVDSWVAIPEWGVGQALLYEDLLYESYGDKARVFLVSDSITVRVAALVMRHNYLINLIEANQNDVVCIAREEIGRGQDSA